MDLAIPQPLHWASLEDRDRAAVLRRPAMTRHEQLTTKVRDIVSDVRNRGDAALREYTARFDGVALHDIEVGADRLASACDVVPGDVLDALRAAIDNLERFHRAQRSMALRIETAPGVVCERISHALDAVGLYVPAGSAPLPSTVLMLAVPARLAGCPQYVLCTPPGRNGRVNETVLAAARLCGVQRVFAVGGAQAIAAMAYGTQTIPRVAKIFGPGNQWVTTAKTLVAADPCGAASDMPAGPSELLVIADTQADPSWVAADLLSQAEHGPDSQVLLLTDNAQLARQVAGELARQAVALTRRNAVAGALRASALIVTDDIGQAVRIANRYAPEHLILNVAKARRWLPQIRNAGSVFLGAYAPESVGDYCSGTNHVLPTYGWARSHSALGLDAFCRSMSVQELSPEGLASIGPYAQRLAEVEGLDGHARAVAIRLGRIVPDAAA